MSQTGDKARTRRPRRTAQERLRRRAQAMAPVALQALVEIMQGGGQPAVRLAAAREILDRAYGRPKLGEAEVESEELTVIVRKFTDPPGCKAVDEGDAA